MKNISKFLYEIGLLKHVKRSGWWLAGIRDPESVAEHSHRAAAIAYLLAVMEKADPERAACIALFHDIHEARVSDLHKVGQRYVEWSDVEELAIADQLSGLPRAMAGRLQGLKSAFQQKKSKEAVIARDADYLECLVQACEYRAQGNTSVEDWITNCRKRLATKSARRLGDECVRTDPQLWWEGLKKKIVAGK